MAIKKEDKTGFSISIASPQKLYEVVSGGFGLKDAVSAWTWNPRAAEVQELRKGLEGKEKKEILEATTTAEALRALYDKNGIDVPEITNVLRDMDNEKNTSNSILPQQWQYTQLKAQDTFNKKWTSIPIVDWFNK